MKVKKLSTVTFQYPVSLCKQTVNNLSVSGMEEAVEDVKRKFGKLLLGSGSSLRKNKNSEYDEEIIVIHEKRRAE